MLKKSFIALILTSSMFSACSHNENVPNTDIDVARAFIKNILEDHFEKATMFVLKDSLNNEYFNLFNKQYHNKSKAELENFKNADIIINEINNLNDSITIINYSNSFKKENKNIIKAVRVNGKWLVDLKYTFSGNL
jgi:hypothetical protein